MVVPKGAVFNCHFTAVGIVRLFLSATARMLDLFESSRTWWTHPSSWVCIHNQAPRIHFNFFLTKAFIPLMVLVCVPLLVSTKFLEWFSWLSGMYGLNWSEKMTVPGRICVVIRRWTCHSLVWLGRARTFQDSLSLLYFLLAPNFHSFISTVFPKPPSLIPAFKTLLEQIALRSHRAQITVGFEREGGWKKRSSCR